MAVVVTVATLYVAPYVSGSALPFGALGNAAAIANPAVTGTLDALSLSSLQIRVAGLLSQAHDTWNPDVVHRVSPGNDLLSRGVKAGNDHYDVAPAYVSIPNDSGDATKLCQVLGVLLTKRVNQYSTSSKSIVKYFISYDSLNTATLGVLGNTATT